MLLYHSSNVFSRMIGIGKNDDTSFFLCLFDSFNRLPLKLISTCFNRITIEIRLKPDLYQFFPSTTMISLNFCFIDNEKREGSVIMGFVPGFEQVTAVSLLFTPLIDNHYSTVYKELKYSIFCYSDKFRIINI